LLGRVIQYYRNWNGERSGEHVKGLWKRNGLTGIGSTSGTVEQLTKEGNFIEVGWLT
jgi:hypothetical protein